MAGCDPIEGGEELVQRQQQVVGLNVVGELGEAHHVGEQDADVRVGLGDQPLAVRQPLGDPARQHVLQQVP